MPSHRAGPRLLVPDSRPPWLNSVDPGGNRRDSGQLRYAR